MRKLNKIFYGPAGTGKTRRAIEEAVRIVTKSIKDIKLDNYNDILSNFKSFSNLPKLNIKNEDLLNDINNKIDFRQKSYKGYNNSDLEQLSPKVEEYNKYPFIETVTFHPSYAYQDFVEGISVETTSKNQIIYSVKDGIFKKICNRAIDNPDYNYVLIIDEINRGDISSIFGELFTLLEDSKRKGEDEEMSINLPYSKDDKGNPEKLTVPSNLHIVATMNTVDKSIALIDVALRRRFDFEECMPQYVLEEFKKCKIIDLSKLLNTMNERISILKNEHYQIGHSYFLNIRSLEELQNIIKKSILPLLQEYFYDDWKSICAVLNQSYENSKENKILIAKEENKKLFKDEFRDLTEYQNKKVFRLNPKLSNEDIKSIYE